LAQEYQITETYVTTVQIICPVLVYLCKTIKKPPFIFGGMDEAIGVDLGCTPPIQIPVRMPCKVSIWSSNSSNLGQPYQRIGLDRTCSDALILPSIPINIRYWFTLIRLLLHCR